MVRVIDTNIFLVANDSYYPFEGCPGFWKFLSKSFKERKIISIKEAYQEILKGGDPKCPMIKWVKARKSYFHPANDEIKAVYGEIAQYVTGKYRNNKDRERFLDKEKADLWLIATAKVKRGIVVTNETRNKKTVPWNKVKIPNVCEKFGVEYETNIYPFMAQKKVRLVLDKKSK